MVNLIVVLVGTDKKQVIKYKSYKDLMEELSDLILPDLRKQLRENRSEFEIKIRVTGNDVENQADDNVDSYVFLRHRDHEKFSSIGLYTE